jgi:uncharacterized protein
MPEYLAPGVYVEEIDTGSKPIEGVSTSTAGMAGVCERGPVNVPILITGFGEYQRWFGGYLNRADFPDDGVRGARCHLPHAVEGFFTNGGKRLYVVRALDPARAARASTFLFQSSSSAPPPTPLLIRANTNDIEVIVANSTGLAQDEWVQIGDGSEAEYRTIAAAPTTANAITLRQPLASGHDAGVMLGELTPSRAIALTGDAVADDPTLSLDAEVFANEILSLGSGASLEYVIVGSVTGASPWQATLREPLRFDHAAATDSAAPQVVGRLAPSGTPIALDADIAAGDITISLDGAVAADNILSLGSGTTLEYVIVDSVTGASPWQATLRTPARFAYTAGTDQAQLQSIVATTIDRAVSTGECVIVVGSTSGLASGKMIGISDGAQTEARQVGQLASQIIAPGAYTSYPAGALVRAVGFIGATGGELDLDAAAGANVIQVNNRQGIDPGDVVRIGLAADPNREYVRVLEVPRRLPGLDSGILVLAHPLSNAHASGEEVHEQAVTAVTAVAPAFLAAPASMGAGALIVSSDLSGATVNFVEVRSGDDVYYHRATSAAAALTPDRLALAGAPLGLPHPPGALVTQRDVLMEMRALDAGSWGNRLRVSVQFPDQALVRTSVRERVDASHIRLSSATGVEAGTLLELTHAGGPTLVKVRSVDRQNNSLITLESALPGAAAVDSAVRSIEFQLDVLLLRQPDPAVPTRNDQALLSESYRNLSLDHRHSRYIHRVIGTTWIEGAANDEDGQPLRRADRRAEGESLLVRVRDNLSGAATEVIRVGPEALFDTLPSGQRRAARRALTGGDDAIASITDVIYIGQDAPEPEGRTGLAALRNEEEIAIVAIPGRISTTLQGALISHCELMRYRFAVLDGPPPPRDALADVQNQRQQFDTKYAALYHPWLSIPDPFPANPAQVADYPVPPSGHVVGVYARTDVERGVHKAPANEVVRGIIGLRRMLNKGEQDILNPFPVNINVIRDFRLDNRGIRVYGGRVITSDPDWKYVNVRRLLIFIENSLDRGLQWVVFEPNAEPLWARVRRTISDFLTVVWRNGALEGTTREEAYFVKCDRTTMTQADIDNGRLIVVIGVAPVKPAEFVIIRIGLWTAHAEE